MKTASSLKISGAAPRKISALLCQALAGTAVSPNVYKALIARFALRQKCA